MGTAAFTTDSAEQAVYWLPLPSAGLLWRAQAALHDSIHPFKLLNVTARNAGPVLDICDGGGLALAPDLGWGVGWGVGRMTEINRSSLLSKLKHIKGMKLLVEQAVFSPC